MLRKAGKEWKFESEVALEDFVWANLNYLLRLTPLKRQYFINGEICDILAQDEDGRLVVLELKNTQDRYIVQQLTRYYDNLLDQKPLKHQVNYELPIRLIAIAPSFHNHNWVDKKYHKLNFEFLSFEINKEDDFVCLSLKNLETESVSQAKILTPSIKDTEDSEFTSDSYTKAVNNILSYYVFVRCAHKLGIPELAPSEILRLSSQRRTKGAKVFKIRLQEKNARGEDKSVSVRVPSQITVGDFCWWVQENVPTATGVVSPNGKYYTIWRLKNNS